MKQRLWCRRSGDVFFIQDFVAWLILLGAAILIFGLFWIAANAFKSKISAPQSVEESFAATRGGAVLRTYLHTKMNEPIEKFLPNGVTGAAPADFALDTADMTFGEAIPLIMEDGACRQAISQHGQSYDAIAALRDSLAPGLCRTFLVRTILFYRMFAADEFVLQGTDGKNTVRIGHGIANELQGSGAQSLEEAVLAGYSDQLRRASVTSKDLKEPATVIFTGSQALPASTPITLRLLAAEPGGSV
jgi:hypothetical protein